MRTRARRGSPTFCARAILGLGVFCSTLSGSCARAPEAPRGEPRAHHAAEDERAVAGGPVLPREAGSPPAVRPLPTSPGAVLSRPRTPEAGPSHGAPAGLADPAEAGPPTWSAPPVDAALLQAEGIRRISGRHVTLYTDLASEAPVDELPTVFDQAVPRWCDYFGLPVERTGGFQLAAYVIQDQDRFRRAGRLPDDLPQFANGYQRGPEIWLYEQPTAYYRRHLLLHEGTHAFMQWGLGGAGPPWYMEGMAELLATHDWRNGALTLGYFPRDKNETPHWGRIKILREDLAAGRGKTLEQVMEYDERAHLQVEPYAWCWAAATFFDGQAAYRDRFRSLRQHVAGSNARFAQAFADRFESEWSDISRQWQVFVFGVDYGYDLDREHIDAKPVQPLPASGATIDLAVDRGWQSSGYRLEKGIHYALRATGRYKIADQPRAWWCEPNGVTLRYQRGLPLGILVGAVVDEREPPSGATPLVRPDPIGLGCEVTPERAGTLYLRINESPAEWADNSGQLRVTVQRVPD